MQINVASWPELFVPETREEAGIFLLPFDGQILTQRMAACNANEKTFLKISCDVPTTTTLEVAQFPGPRLLLTVNDKHTMFLTKRP